ncbi:MAG: quinol:cytochrome c oxidoreductase iron-sulfur protein precursor [Candidatus Angelobacter sp.]|nr:quinol:cytochrome c oxidoreductase iron-sulfur protein precursor [Candidatus Angelobacter sp.]
MSNKSDLNPNLISASEIKPASMELETVRKKLAEAKGPKYWRTLEELADQKAFGELLEREFPRQASEWVDPVSRRGFLKLAGASMALAGLAGCTRQPLEQILPYVRQPEQLIPGKPIFYATAMPFHGHALPLLVETHEFRPTKVEGNPAHAASMGATDLFAQASILNLYDPDRSTALTYMGELSSWGDFATALNGKINDKEGLKARHGAGLRFLTGATSSPTFGWQMKAVQQALPQSKWHRWDPINRDNMRAGSRLAFGGYYDPIYKFENAAVVLSLDADFLSGAWFPGFVRYARDFMRGRKLENGDQMNRLYVAESAPSTTGAKADNRLVLRPSEVETVARALAAKVGAGGAAGNLTPEQQKFVDAVAADLTEHKGKCLVVPGEFQSPTVYALAQAINGALGNVGQTVTYIDPVEVDPVEHGQSIKELIADMNAGKVDTLVIIGGNPAYSAPVDLDFLSAVEKVKLRIQFSSYKNETTDYMHWHVPGTHYLEAWSDARSYDGTAIVIQPMIMPLYDGKSEHEVLAMFTDQPGTSSHDLVQTYWKSQHPTGDFETFWRTSVHDGFVANTVSAPKQISAKAGSLPAPSAPADGIEVSFRPDPTIYDGSFINNAWLQETPKPLSRNTWDNVAMISPAMARKWGLYLLENENDHQSDAQRILEIVLPDGRKVEAPYWPQPGHPDNAVTLFLGYGQTRTGRVGTGTGYNAYKVRSSGSQYIASGAKINVTNRSWDIAVTQGHFSMDGREPVKVATLEEFIKNPKFAHENPDEEPQDKPGKPESLYPDYREKGWYKLPEYAWGMSIDLNSCVGCQACAVACQAENNIAVVGKEQVQRGREMQWIRIDSYYEGDPANPSVYFQPVPCMQCENAPCEPVCPVGATTHSTEGLNDMVYNRCVGTRYCSNNCPYKVRRFNFFLFADYDTPSLKLGRNPDVTVRSRGVMEKCTYCVQRITQARIAAEKEDRAIREGEIKTACQQVCPTEAIIFGDINNKNSAVAKLRSGPRKYDLLAELNTRPRTTYVAAVRNPNPKLESGTEKT